MTVAAVLTTLVLSLIGRQIWEILPALASRLVNIAVTVLPRRDRKRYREEWQADIAGVKGGLFQLAWALGCLNFAISRAWSGRFEPERRLPASTPIASVPTTAWPWKAQYAAVAPTIIGASPAVRLCLESEALSLEAISHILAGGDMAAPCQVTWLANGNGRISVELKWPDSEGHLTFVRRGGELSISYDLFAIRAGRQSFGMGKTLVRNLLFIADALRVQYMSTYACEDRSSYVWAALGAAPMDPAICRYKLERRVDEALKVAGSSSLEYGSAVRDIIDEASDFELMAVLASLKGEQGEKIGKALVGGVSWDAYFDFSNNAQRKYVSEVLA